MVEFENQGDPNSINVLDQGYVRLVKTSGSEIEVVNAARGSFDKESELNEDGSLKEKDKGLISFLAKNREGSPFRHLHFTFENYAPLMVARQWFKYVVGSSHLEEGLAWNETSRRYVTETPTFHVPDEWRSKPENKKQGSGEPLDETTAQILTNALCEYLDEGERLYNWAMEKNAAPEQARLFLPAYGMYIRWRWTCSLQAVLWMMEQRLEHDAQKEMQDFAKAVYQLTYNEAPYSVEEWLKFKN